MGDDGLRLATAEDGKALRVLINEAFGVERAIKKGGGDRLPAGSDELEQFLARGTFLVAEQGGQLLACIYLEERGERCYLGLLSVAPSAQGAGRGRLMMQAAESLARERGCRWMDLRVVSQRRDSMVPLYEKLGFMVSGREEYLPALAEQMVEPGYFVVMTKEISADLSLSG